MSDTLWIYVLALCGLAGGNLTVTESPRVERLGLKQLMSWVPGVEEVLRNNNSNSACVLKKLDLLRDAESLDQRALHILDSWGKLPPGVLQGNINQLGDYDECVSAGGCYCLPTLDLQLPSSLHDLDSQLHSHYFMTSTLTDPGHRMPRASLIHWATCLPEPCTAQDLQEDLSQVLSTRDHGLQIHARVDPDLCQCPRSKDVVPSKLINLAWLFFCGIILLCLVGTVSENGGKAPNTNQGNMQVFLESFSLRRNLDTLLDLKPPGAEDIPCLHGIRALNALGLLLSHKQMALLFLPLINRTHLATMIARSWSMIGRSAILYTDSFILLSGFLTARSLLRELSRSNTINLSDNLLSRFIRLTPSLAALILFCTAMLPSLGSGPLWSQLVEKYSTLCQQYWWRNLLFIHNQYPFDQMCLTHSHQVGIDMQLFLTAPLLVFMIWRWRSLGVALLASVAVWSSYLRYSVALSEQLSTVIYYGAPLSQLFRTATKTYILPTHRATVYCLGIALAAFLRQRRVSSLTKVQATVGWLMGVGCGLFAVFAPFHMSWTSYIYNPLEAALYNMLAPVLWSMFVAWVIFACNNGYGGWFGDLLEWKWFAVFTRISYAVYLTQFPIFFFNISQVRTSQQYTFFKLVDLPEFAVVIIASVVLTLFIDLPAQNLKKAFLSTAKRSLRNSESENQDYAREKISNNNVKHSEQSKPQKQLRNRLPG